MKLKIYFTFCFAITVFAKAGVILPAGPGHVDASLFPSGSIEEAEKEACRVEKKSEFILVDGQKRFKREFKPLNK